jgi:hypothetical protein
LTAHDFSLYYDICYRTARSCTRDWRHVMYAVIGRVRIKPGHEDETRAMIADHGISMVRGMAGSAGGYWTRSAEGGDLVQHSFWLFDTEENARAAEGTFSTLRDMPEAPATFISVDVCEVVGQVEVPS